jgi:hypothetical protein
LGKYSVEWTSLSYLGLNVFDSTDHGVEVVHDLDCRGSKTRNIAQGRAHPASITGSRNSHLWPLLHLLKSNL